MRAAKATNRTGRFPASGFPTGFTARHTTGPRAPSPSFYALHLLEHDIWKFPTNTVKVAEAEEMRAKLAPDVERMAQNDALAEYHELAIQSGTTLAEAVCTENLIRVYDVMESPKLAE